MFIWNRLLLILLCAGFVFSDELTKKNITCGIKEEKIDEKFVLTCVIENQAINATGIYVSMNGTEVEEVKAFLIKDNAHVAQFPENLDIFKELESVEVRNCSITSIPSHIFAKVKLTSLNLYENKIALIEVKAFDNLELKNLNLGKNEIKTLNKDIFAKLGNLRKISLSENKMTSIPATLFKNNLNLESIDLHGNKIIEIDPIMFNSLTKLSIIDLRNNTCVDQLFNGTNIENINKSKELQKCHSKNMGITTLPTRFVIGLLPIFTLMTMK